MSRALIESINGMAPFIGEGTWLAPNATVVGEVHIGSECSIWYNAVLRGDVGRILVGDRTNIQDGCVLHSTTGKSRITIGNEVTVGHRAIIHGCTIDDRVLIGMGAIILDNAHIESGAIVAAGAVVLEKTQIPGGTIWAGVPARQVKIVDMAKTLMAISKMAEGYVGYKKWYHSAENQ